MGTVEIVTADAVRKVMGDQFVSERIEIGVPFPADDDLLIRFDIETCLLTRTSGFGDFSPRHETWHARA
jgi:hypothetical protein